MACWEKNMAVPVDQGFQKPTDWGRLNSHVGEYNSNVNMVFENVYMIQTCICMFHENYVFFLKHIIDMYLESILYTIH